MYVSSCWFLKLRHYSEKYSKNTIRIILLLYYVEQNAHVCVFHRFRLQYSIENGSKFQFFQHFPVEG